MKMIPPDSIAAAYDEILRRFCVWAQDEPNVRAALVIGSRARCDHAADAWADLDMIIAAREPALLWDEDAWCSQFGTLCLSFRDPAPAGAWERRVLYAGGLDVDFAPIQADLLAQAAERGLSPWIADLLSRGFCVVIDKDGFSELLGRLPLGLPPYQPPSGEIFGNLLADALYHVLWAAKRLRRGELWRAKYCCDVYLKDKLLALLTWHAHALQPQVDTWMGGRQLDLWADPRAWRVLQHAYAYYDQDDVWRALRVTFDLLCWLGKETAQELDYPYPASASEHIARWLDQTERERYDDQPPSYCGEAHHAR